MITDIHGHTSALWKARNDILHDKENEAMMQIRSETLASITDYHLHPEKLLFDDRHLCSMPREKRLKASTSTQRRWALRKIKESLEQYTRQGTRQTLPLFSTSTVLRKFSSKKSFCGLFRRRGYTFGP
jgi:hypothetical protein